MKPTVLLPLVAILALVACGPEAPPNKPIETNGSDRSGSSAPAPAKGPDWSAMIAKIKNLESRKTEVLSLMQQAVDKFGEYKVSKDRAVLDQVKDLKEQAGSIYDEIIEDLAKAAGGTKLGDELLKKRLSSFESSFQRLANMVSRKKLGGL
jgi:hypothetical protein